MSKHVVIDLEMCRVAKEMRKECRTLNEIIQIGAVLLDENMMATDRISLFVKPEFGWIDPFIERLTGISQVQVSNAPLLAEAMNAFLEWLPKEDVIAVSWSMTDKIQLERELKAKGLEFEEMDHLFATWEDCQADFTRRAHVGRKYSLSDAMIATDIEGEGRAHDGLADAYNTALLYAKIANEPELVLNPYFTIAHNEKKGETLSFCLGDLLKGLDILLAMA